MSISIDTRRISELDPLISAAMSIDDMFIISKPLPEVNGPYAKKTYESRSITLGNLQAFLDDAHHSKQETSSAVRLSSQLSTLSNDLSTKYLHLLSSKVSYDWLRNF